MEINGNAQYTFAKLIMTVDSHIELERSNKS